MSNIFFDDFYKFMNQNNCNALVTQNIVDDDFVERNDAWLID